ncbi:MAG: hypothetical protein DRJ18_00125 [Candidatus Methanomethylicota archaeon]|nr:MAG: hypothetical protein DRJ18_00125 [Candidatus Verstraetearchaeota archaeon]
MSFVETEVVLTDSSRETVYYLTEEGKKRVLNSVDYSVVYRLRCFLSVIRDCLHKQLVEFFEQRIIRVLERSGKAWRRTELWEQLYGDFFWMEYHEAIQNLLEKGEIIEKRGWIKLKKKEAFEE